MNVAELKEATRLWDLASLDGGVKGLTFARDAVYYEGFHSGAYRKLDVSLIDNLDGPVVVTGKTLNAALSLLDEDEDVVLHLKGNEVILGAGSARAHVRVADGSDFGHATEFVGDLRVHVPEFAEAVNFASVGAAKAMTNPITTGVNIVLNTKGRILLQATDAAGRACITAVKAAEFKDPFAITAQGEDLLTALACVGDLATLGMDGTILCVSGGDTVVRLSPLMGDFPKLARLPRKFAHKFDLPSASVELVARAATTFDTDRLASISLKADGTLSVSAEGQEIGSFEAHVGTHEVPDPIEFTFDALLLGAAEHLGDTITFNYTSNATPVLMTGPGGRYYWLSPVLPR